MRAFAVLGLLIAAGLSTATPGHAYVEGPWCVRYDVGSGVIRENCEMPSFEACQQERVLGGTTAFCSPNPAYVVPQQQTISHGKKK